MIVETHAHTSEHSACSHVSAVDLVQRALLKELQGVVLTDHHYLWSAEELAALRVAAGLPDHFLVLAGQEVRSGEFGDVLVYGAGRAFGPGTSIDAIRTEFPDAALVWAHPYRKEKIPVARRLLDPRLDGIEIFNSNQTVAENIRGLRDWHRYKFNALGGTDTHSISTTGTYPTIFDHPFGSVEEMALEIRHGRCRPFFKEIPKSGSRIQVTEITIGTKGIDDTREKIIVKTHPNLSRWRSAERAYAIIEQVAAHGFAAGRYRVPRPLGHDSATHTLIEEGVRGRSLYDKLVRADAQTARSHLDLAASWLARLHNCRLRLTPPAEFLGREKQHLSNYLEYFERLNHPKTRRVAELVERIYGIERALFAGDQDGFVQGHGDFHLKNILIGNDNSDDRHSTFVAVIDFDSSHCMPPAFDVGTFLAQYKNQLFHLPEVRDKAPDRLFLNRYLADSGSDNYAFLTQVELFKARADLSIARYLLKVGLGDSEDLHRILVDAEKGLTLIAMRQAEVRAVADRTQKPRRRLAAS